MDPIAWSHLSGIEKAVKEFSKSSAILSICMILLAVAQTVLSIMVFIDKK